MPVGVATPDPRSLAQRLAAYGCTTFIRLDEKLSAPAQLDYLDLLPTRRNLTPALTAVAEHQGTALLYVVDEGGEAKSDPTSLPEVRRQLANRSDPAWLGLLRSGSLEIFPIGFRKTSLNTVQMPEAFHSPFAGATAAAEALHVSKHRRCFPWPDEKGAATEITVYHVWPSSC